MRVSITGIAVALMVVLGIAAQPAHAYIDPGTGSSLFSSLGIMLGVMVTMFAFCITQFRRCGGWLWAKFRLRNEPEVGTAKPVSKENDNAT